MKPEDPLVDMQRGQAHAAYQSHQDWAGGRGLGTTKKFSVGALLQVKADHDTHNYRSGLSEWRQHSEEIMFLDFSSSVLEAWRSEGEEKKTWKHLIICYLFQKFLSFG